MPDDRKPGKPHSGTDVRRELLDQMKRIRESLDPKLVERAKLAVFGKVPFDRDSARQAVASFLDSREDGGAFRRKLEAELRKEGTAPEPPGQPPAPPVAASPAPLPPAQERPVPGQAPGPAPDGPAPQPPRPRFNRIA
ncbi:hypothetical protein [Azospirillum sp. SYSU D00513]|uniref:hypothetical protein n=1 Tax=Azospirillum sp. SYSU D00513 TaxID=2812561 RepID=UPI001A95B136|nr:hypothetical protein [Azospirillum sp. SYSU D00513]